jgi:hypothetical protein
MKHFILRICKLITSSVFLGLSACANSPDVPPLMRVFSLETAGNTLETKLHIEEKQTYTFGLSFLSLKSDKNDHRRVNKLTGDGLKNYITGIYNDPGVPLSIRLKIESVADTVVPFHFDQVISEIPAHMGWGGCFPAPDNKLDTYLCRNKKIANVMLEPGVYRVSVENRLAVPATHGTPIYFHIERAYLGK